VRDKKRIESGLCHTSGIYMKYGLFISHNTTSFYLLFIQADNMFRITFLGHLQVTRNVGLEEVIQVIQGPAEIPDDIAKQL